MTSMKKIAQIKIMGYGYRYPLFSTQITTIFLFLYPSLSYYYIELVHLTFKSVWFLFPFIKNPGFILVHGVSQLLKLKYNAGFIWSIKLIALLKNYQRKSFRSNFKSSVEILSKIFIVGCYYLLSWSQFKFSRESILITNNN